MDAMQILVIILASFLALFLVLAIVLTILVIKVTLQIKRVTTTAQNAAEHLSTFASNASQFSSPLALGKMIFGRIKKARNKRK